MTKKNNLKKGNSSLSNHKKKGTSKNSWKHQMYELEIAIAKESSNKKRNELIKIHNGYMSEYDSLKKQIIWLAVLGICFLLVLVVFIFGKVTIVRICLIHHLAFKRKY